MSKIMVLLLVTSNLALGQTPRDSWPPTAKGAQNAKTMQQMRAAGLPQEPGFWGQKEFGPYQNAPELPVAMLQASQYKGRFSYRTPSGSLVYALAADKMPCLVPKPGIKDDMVIRLAADGKWPEPMPNATPRIEVIPSVGSDFNQLIGR
jgi:hypothetical protein